MSKKIIKVKMKLTRSGQLIVQSKNLPPPGVYEAVFEVEEPEEEIAEQQVEAENE